MKSLRLLFAAFFLLSWLVGPGLAQMPSGGIRCPECGMTVDLNSLYISRAVTAGGGELYFCDIGDMLIYVQKKKKLEAKELYVRDYASGLWIGAQEAFYARSEKFRTPMGWDIAAFGSQKDALEHGKAVPWDKALSLIK